jgi:hypothetical protein
MAILKIIIGFVILAILCHLGEWLGILAKHDEEDIKKTVDDIKLMVNNNPVQFFLVASLVLCPFIYLAYGIGMAFVNIIK